jgi:hypothetical protein
MAIQNTSATAGTVSVTYYDAAGTATAKSFSIAPNGSLGVYQGSGTDGPPVGAYTAVIQSTLPLAAIVNEQAPAGTGSARQSTSYNTFGAGSSTIHLPLVENGGSDPLEHRSGDHEHRLRRHHGHRHLLRRRYRRTHRNSADAGAGLTCLLGSLPTRRRPSFGVSGDGCGHNVLRWAGGRDLQREQPNPPS